MHQTGTLVENFEIDIQFMLRQCFRPTLVETFDPESSEYKSDDDSDSNSGDGNSGDNRDDTHEDNQGSGQDALLTPKQDVLTRASLVINGVQFRLINNIVDQESPVVEFDSKAIEIHLRSESNSMVDIAASCRVEALYQNLRLVTMEPLIEPWSVNVTLSQRHARSMVPVHIVSSGEGYVMVRPPEIGGTDTTDGDNGGVLPKAYAKERVHLPLFDRSSSSANENLTHTETDELGETQCTIKFRRLYSDRPVRPFMMNVCLSSASSALYHRTLSFHPPLIVHNLTAGSLDFCLATPSDWSPAVDAVTLTDAGMNAGWETREQRLRERGTINVADSLIWHLSSEETPLELSVRMKGFDWSEPLALQGDLGDLVRIKMKDLVSDAFLYITAEIRMSLKLDAIEVCHSSAKMMTPSVIDMTGAAGSMPNSRVMSPVNPVVQLDAGAFADFHWTLRFAKTRTIRCRFTEYGWSWSGAVPLGESGEYAVRMRHESTRESKLVRVALKLDSSCLCVYFREERTTAPPYRVENYSLETLRTHQHRVRRSEILLPHHSLDYAWDEPTEDRLLVVDMLPSAAGDNSRPLRIGSFDLDKIQQYPDALGGTLGIEISTDGPTRVLRFTDTRLRMEKAMPVSAQTTNDMAAKAELSERSGMQVLQRFVIAPTVHAALRLQGVGISVVDNAPKELLYMSVSGIALEVLISEDDQGNNVESIAGSVAELSRLERETRPRIIACCLEVNDIQVDNQLQMTPYPVLLRFSNPSGRSRIVNGQTVNIPVLQVNLVKHDEYAGIEFIRHFSISVLPVHIRVDGSLLYQMLPLLIHARAYGGGSKTSVTAKKTAVVLATGDNSSREASRAAHSHLLLKDFNASLEISVKVLEAAQKDNTTSAGPTSRPTTPTVKIVARRYSGPQQAPSPRQNQHTALAAEIQRYTVAKYGSLGDLASRDEQKKLYFEEFHVDPIRATVSFSFGDSAGAIMDGNLPSLSHAAALTGPSSSRDSSVTTVGPLRLILNAIGTSLTKIANAPFQLKALHIHNSFVQPDALATRLASHYQSEALRQAYVILGSVDVLGNPMIAWKNLRSGFQDFISEPAHGLSQRSPQAFAFGVGRGSLSLVRASVYTFLDFNTRILTAFSLGLSEACLKLDDYTGYPATRHIFQGLVQGVSGVVVAPIHSFEVNGARGVLPGFVAGAFGVVLKPLLGFSLATATTAATLRDAVDPNTKALLVRVRPPRHIDLRTRRLKVYSYVESLGEEIVGKIRGGRYRTDGYLGHVDLKGSHQCFLVTRKRILFLNVKTAASTQATKYDVQWELLAEEVVMVDCSRTPNEQMVTIYYMEDEFRSASGAGHSTSSGASSSNAVTTHRRRTPGVPRGMFLQKHEVTLPDTKVLFVRAMLQQQERSLLTKMNSYTGTDEGTLHHVSLSRTPSMELTAPWQPQHQYMPLDYPVFRLPPSLHPTRSFANLTQATPSHLQGHHAQHHDNLNEQ
ncbi:hypothetical protein BBJ29_001611 [Phytophthora kernoviae]|uniref:Vacuolar protein sorting-associated protein 13 DH-like domain-containing protein n=1 Tax=Phytophthora kernoviae TaxID=325452 RepID=A0A3F2RWC4_9STRA|nr:hypothetical protein BBJ29_001611 [Phytophthora kernoviae]RLN65524.1 hypothetical protein BBP00_00002794 [Phytophthora kernoviae]